MERRSGKDKVMSYFNLFDGGDSSTSITKKNKGGPFEVNNPYSTVKTNHKKMNANLAEGSAFDTINNFVNSNIGNILNDYLNPSLNSTTNQALLKNYAKTLNNMAHTSFENNVVNPLSKRNMIRSSQATDMYNSFNNNLSDNISNYIDSLLTQSQTNSANMLNNLMNNYMNGVNSLYKNQALALQGSLGNSTTKTTTNGNSGGSSNTLGNLGSLMLQMLPYLLL